MKHAPLVLGLVAALAAGTTLAQSTNNVQAERAAPNPSSTTDAPDAKFVETASASGLAEVALGNLGAQKGQSHAVKDFGQQMVTDHTKANDQLKQLAASKNVPVSKLPLGPDTVAAARIGNLPADKFDKEFSDRMVKDHKKVVALFENEASSGKDPQFKAFAAQTLPILRQHLEMAQQLPTETGAGR
jgi:putative membrane protein